MAGPERPAAFLKGVDTHMDQTIRSNVVYTAIMDPATYFGVKANQVYFLLFIAGMIAVTRNAPTIAAIFFFVGVAVLRYVTANDIDALEVWSASRGIPTMLDPAHYSHFSIERRD